MLDICYLSLYEFIRFQHNFMFGNSLILIVINRLFRENEISIVIIIIIINIDYFSHFI